MLESLKKFEQNLELWSFIYLSAPLIIFFIGFLKPVIYIIFILLFIVCAKKIFFECQLNCKKSNLTYPKKKVIYGIIIFIFFWVFLSGSGGFSFQNEDYVKHNAILFDLINLSWPITYEIKTLDGQENIFSLIYYFP